MTQIGSKATALGDLADSRPRATACGAGRLVRNVNYPWSVVLAALSQTCLLRYAPGRRRCCARAHHRRGRRCSHTRGKAMPPHHPACRRCGSCWTYLTFPFSWRMPNGKELEGGTAIHAVHESAPSPPPLLALHTKLYRTDLTLTASSLPGYNNIAVEAAAARGIPVTTGPGVNSASVAEGALMSVLMIARKVRAAKPGNMFGGHL